MRIFCLLGISVALAFQPLYAHAADEPAETATTPRPADDPDAIGSLHAPKKASPLRTPTSRSL